MRVRIGIFVGGRGTRMGGAAKGLLALPSGERLLDRLLAECRAALPEASIVLVGAAEAYESFALPALADQPCGIGPIGGLAALLLDAEQSGATHAVALACDLPYISRALISRLATVAPEALAVAPRRAAIWEPLCARYAVLALPHVRAAISDEQRSLQKLFARLAEHARAISIDATEEQELTDWDSPEDLARR
jgi:molybdopterin-guanine dinucleotide biosynthesis protein A